MPPTSYSALLRGNRNFRLLWLGQIVSQLGDWFNFVTLQALLLRLTGEATPLAFLWIAQSLPLFLLGPVAGVVVDRLPRKQVMIVADLARAAIALGFLAVRSPASANLAFLLYASLSCFSAFFEPARTASVPNLTTREELVTANALSSVTWSLILTSGALAGGLVVHFLGYQAAFLLNAVSFLASALLIARLRMPPEPARREGSAGGFSEVRAGLRYVQNHPGIAGLMTAKMGWGLAGGLQLLVAIFGQRIFPLGNDPEGALSFGLLLALGGQLKLLPARGCWGRPSRGVFIELFAFARDMFLTAVGLQLLNASQLVVISRTLGFSAAAVWSVANKAYPVAFQGVSRIFDFSGTALGELHIRGERDKLRRRYADVFVLTASAAIFAGATMAVCNTSFMTVWTKGEIAWPRQNDVLLGLLLALTCVTRCSIGLSGYLKNIGAMRWVYFFEGVSFFVTSLLIAPHLGMTGILAVAILANVVWSGAYGFRRTGELLGIPTSRVVGWLKTAGKYALLMAPVVALLWWIASRVPPLAGLVANTVVMGTLGFGLFWLIGLTPELRAEIKSTFRKLIP